jgi:hypothetical protein
MRQTFKCGHVGLGKFCHRCQQAVSFLDRSKATKDEKVKIAFKAEGERLLTVPRKASAPVAPAAPVPA